jgi:TRAP-type mannitol/chloroaromatic compound transport system substrate-binding protein
MTSPITRRQALVGGVAATGAATLPRPALSRNLTQWRMVTSWPANLPGPGVSAARLAERIGDMSGGRLTIDLYAADELVPAFEVFDAVSAGTAEIGHTASFFWQGKVPAAVFFTTVPFGLTPPEHVAWVEHGGGQELWDELYAPHGIKPYMAGNTGFQMGGWFRNPVGSLEDLRGVSIRAAGIGAEVFRRLGMNAQAIPPAEILPALQQGVVEAVEFLGAFSDMALGFHRAAPHYLWPSFNKPNGTGEALVSRAALDELSPDLREIVATACAREATAGLAEADWMNGRAIEQLVTEHDVQLAEFPRDVVEAARVAAEDVISELAAESPEARRVVGSYAEALDRLGSWSRVSIGPFLAGRSPSS